MYKAFHKGFPWSTGPGLQSQTLGGIKPRGSEIQGMCKSEFKATVGNLDRPSLKITNKNRTRFRSETKHTLKRKLSR